MKIYEKDIDDITIDDINQLIGNKINENNYLEYKSEMSGEKETNNILRTICGFANNNGGLFIYGLTEENGIPKHTSGVALNSDWDTKKLGYYNLISEKIEPKINIDIGRIQIPDSEKNIILFKVPVCMNYPYRVKNKNFKDFFKRQDGQTVSVPYMELKDIFKNKEKQFEKIDEMHNIRLNKFFIQFHYTTTTLI